jgi:hypothetical protein
MHARIDHEFLGPAACLLDPQFHCSRVSAESGKSSGCWLKQHTDDAMSNQATVRDEVQTVVQARGVDPFVHCRRQGSTMENRRSRAACP